MRLPSMALVVCAVLWASPALAQSDEAGVEIDSALFGAVRARCIGPAVMSGRIAALDASASDPNLLFVGAASGGVWRSRDGGATFDAVFDDHPQSIGAICIDPTDDETVWVGTGETWVRNSTSVGAGVYKTTNGGEAWSLMGLEDSERIGKILVDPLDTDTAYVAALGHLWGPNEERGVFKTTDGGETWENVLYVDENTGCTDLAMVPTAPNVLFAAMWEFRRSAAFFKSGGPGCGLYRSIDGGTTWEELKDGLPGEMGRIAISISPARPSRIFAAVEAKDSGFYRSDDMGLTWERTSDQTIIKGRPFYFSLVVADPVDPDRVYKPGFQVYMSRDGGKMFEPLLGWVHVDYHALWINPNNPKHMVAGTDGGVYITYNRGNGWRHVQNLPVSQFYRISVDDDDPYYVYGGLQDNGSWRAPSRSPGGVENADWENVGGGDGFCTLRDPLDENIVYWEWQGGNINRLHLDTGDSKWIVPEPAPEDPEYRWGWNTPIYISPTDPTRLYVGSQYLLRSTDRGETWVRLSDDLTTNDPQKLRQLESGGLTIDNTTAENHCTIFAIAESRLDENVLWVGTDDGNVQVSEDDGETWTLVSKDIPGLPEGTWVSSVEPSRTHRQGAFVTFDGHRSGDKKVHVYRTDDLGQSWRSLTTDHLSGYAHVVRQDPVNSNLLYLGTEGGLYMTLDCGMHWAHYSEDFPPVSVRDMVIHEREHSLILGTHGRGAWIIDDLRPLRQVTPEALAQDVFLLQSPPAMHGTELSKQHFPGDTQFIGDNAPQSAQIIYFLKKRHLMGDMKIEIFSAEGELVGTLPGGKRKGINIARWDMRRKPPKVTSSGTLDPFTAYAGSTGPMVPEGTYTYKLSKGKQAYTGTLEIAADPDSPHSLADRALQQRTANELYDLLERVSYVAQAIVQARDDARDRAEALGEDDRLSRRLEEFADELTQFRHTFVRSEEQVQGISGEIQMRERLVRLYAAVALYSGRPGATNLARIAHFEGEVAKVEARFASFMEERLSQLNEQLVGKESGAIEILTFEKYREQDGPLDP